jgi:hypothetical protein
MPANAASARPKSDVAEWGHLHCSFCGRNSNHVRFLSAGVAGGKICDACCFKAFAIFLRAHVTHAFGLLPVRR